MCDDCVLASSRDIIYEIHITVDVSPDDSETVARFKEVCAKIGTKGIVIENLSPSGNIYYDVMTSGVVKTSFDVAKEEMMSQASLLESMGFDVIRRKIETVSWNYPLNPEVKGYFESHNEFDVEDYDDFSSIVRNLGGYASRNVSKPGVAIGTIRRKSKSWWLFGDELGPFINGLSNNGYVAKKTINEYCPFDDNEKHDDTWIKG